MEMWEREGLEKKIQRSSRMVLKKKKKRYFRMKTGRLKKKTSIEESKKRI